MSNKDKMRSARLAMETATLTLAEALGWASSRLDPQTGWLLAEAPQQIIWRRLADVDVRDVPAQCENLLIFGPEAELRLNKGYAAEAGSARLVTLANEGKEGHERLSAYLLGKGGAMLEFAEFFCADEQSGLLRLEFARYCGVRGEK